MEKDKDTDFGNIKVVCRVRPPNQFEMKQGSEQCIEFIDDKTLKMKFQNEAESKKQDFKPFYQFDGVFDAATSQKQIYEFAAKPVVESVLQGFNGTIFAYGQTSSGKTFTMQGPSLEDQNLKGIIPRMIDNVFSYIMASPDHLEFKIKVSIVEIYMENIRDLLDTEKTNLKIREDKTRGIYIQDATESYVSDQTNVYDLMEIGNNNRAIAATNMNEGSSRSHMIFMLHVSQNNLVDMSAKAGKLFLVDLAGSEKISKTGAQGTVLEESKKINQSLSELGNVINALTDNKQMHIPYRNSKLTRILQESLGGNAKTTLIITCSPSIYNEVETLGTLRFGVRAKKIKNKPKINKEWTVAELLLLLSKAEKELEMKNMRIQQLEEFIKMIGQSVPESNVLVKIQKTDAEEEEIRLREQVRNLEDELQAERQTVTNLNAKINDIKKEYGLLSSKFNSFEQENEVISQKSNVLKVLMEEMDTKLQQRDYRSDELEARNQELLRDCELHKLQNEQMQNNIESLKRDINLLEKQVQLQQKDEINKLMAKLKIENKQLAKNNNDNESLLKKIIEKAKKGEIDLKDIELENNEQQQEDQQPVDHHELKSIKEKVSLLTEKNRFLEEEINNLKNINQILQSNLDKNQGIDVQIQKNIDLQTKLDECQNKKKQVEKDLENRVTKVVQLEMKIFEQKEIIMQYEAAQGKGEKLLKQRVQSLENNLEQLTQAYHELLSQQSNWKIDSQVGEKRLSRKNERIMQLENKLGQTKEELLIYKTKYESMNDSKNIINKEAPKSFFEKHQQLAQNEHQDNQKNLLNHKIVKPVRGGLGFINQFSTKTPTININQNENDINKNNDSEYLSDEINQQNDSKQLDKIQQIDKQQD